MFFYLAEMADHEFHYFLNQIQLRPNVRLWWPKAIALCALLGGIYGAALGSALGAVPGAAEVIAIASAVLALFCGAPGARYGFFFFSIVRRAGFGRLFVGTVAAIGGAIVGGFLATMVLLALGAILGAVGGWMFAQSIMALGHGVVRRFLGGIAGAVLGMLLGAILWAVRLNQAGALVGAGWGLGIGAAAGPLLLLLFIGTLRLVPHVPRSDQRNDQGNIVDASFRRED
jgi:hypothetical protein